MRLSAKAWLVFLTVALPLAVLDLLLIFQQTPPGIERERTPVRQIMLEALILGAHHPWAGGYYRGDGLGLRESLTLAPERGYAFQKSYCTGSEPLRSGPVYVRRGVLYLDGSHTAGLAAGLIPVYWGKRHYLIPRSRLVDFANAINAGWEPRHEAYGRFFLRNGDWELPATGLPSLPRRTRPLLHAIPVRARVLSAGPAFKDDPDYAYSDTVNMVMLDAGRREGVVPGLELLAERSGGLTATVARVYADRSAAAVIRFSAGERAPKPGDLFSTRPSWADQRALARRGIAVKRRFATGLPPFSGAAFSFLNSKRLAAARRHGVHARRVAAFQVHVVDGGFGGKDVDSELDAATARLGANARTAIEDGGRAGGPFRVDAWLLEQSGEPVSEWPFAWDSEAAWKIDAVERSLSSMPAERARTRIYAETMAPLLRLTTAQALALNGMRAEDLNDEQRRAFVTSWGLRTLTGPVGNKRDEAAAVKFNARVRELSARRIAAYEASHPAEVKAYQRRQDEWSKLLDEALAADDRALKKLP